MVDEMPGMVASESAAEAGSTGLVSLATARWEWVGLQQHWFKLISGVAVIITREELITWEKRQRVDGKDLARGLKLNARLDKIVSER